MTALRKNAIDLLEHMPEDKLIFLVQIMQGLDGLDEEVDDPEVSEAERMEAFETLECMRKSIPSGRKDRQRGGYADN